MVHDVVEEFSLYKPLPLVSGITSLPALAALLMHLRPCVVHGNGHTGSVGDDEGLRSFVHPHIAIEELTCGGMGHALG